MHEYIAVQSCRHSASAALRCNLKLSSDVIILHNCLCMNKERIFESIENARKFYESENYTAARAVRESAGDTDLILVEGLLGAL